jgi:hypothetical protein
MSTQVPLKLDIDEEGSVVDEPIIPPPSQNPVATGTVGAAVCDDVFCDIKTVEQAVFKENAEPTSKSDHSRANVRDIPVGINVKPRSAGV